MGPGRTNALAQDVRDDVLFIRRDVFADHFPAQRQRQLARSFPPFAKVNDFGKSLTFVCHLPLMDDQSNACPSLIERTENLIERHRGPRRIRRGKAATHARRVSSQPQESSAPYLGTAATRKPCLRQRRLAAQSRQAKRCFCFPPHSRSQCRDSGTLAGTWN
jgi:hypothetical protein